MNPDIQYIGERLWAGTVGHFFIILSFVASLQAAVAYFFAEKNPTQTSWLTLARFSFRAHVVGVAGIMATLFFLLYNHYYEYSYIWQHSSNSMPMRYIFSCFWEGQEGSFLLWTVWHAFIGLILQRTAKSYETGVMCILSLVQAFLATMLLGIVVFGTKIGSNPFILLRENPDFSNIPLFNNPKYIEKLDGRGLNPLLQNYWMTIHPPTLFLGFSLTVVPFAYALTGLWRKEFAAWQKPALPWAFTGVMVLGLGVLMGGAWAYEALSFGGFWAWDPVENSSLVPWLTLVAAAHLMLVNKSRGNSLFSSTLLTLSSFILVLYSTFLTRSGVLGSASVHAFTDLGMQKQLLLYLLSFVFLSVYLLQQHKIIAFAYTCISAVFFLSIFAFNIYPGTLLSIWGGTSFVLLFLAYFFSFPKDKEEEQIYSREFWLFIAAFILFLSALTISIFTSIPVFNKMFGTHKAPFTIDKYNAWEIPFAIIIALLLAVGQFFKYKKTDKKDFFNHFKISGLVALFFGGLAASALFLSHGWQALSSEQKTNNILYSILMLVSAFALFANTEYWLRILKGRIKHLGASLAHIGFALLLIGALISTSKKTTLSKNTSQKSVSSLGKEFDDKKSILLVRGDTLPMPPYYVSYVGKQKEGVNMKFKVEYFTQKDKKYKKVFELSPLVQMNARMGNIAEPDTRRFLSRDIYTHVTYANLDNDDEKQTVNDYAEPQDNLIHLHDTLYSSNAILILDSLRTNLTQEQYQKNDSALTVTAVFHAFDIEKKIHRAYPKYRLIKNSVEPISDSIPELGLRLTFWKINPEEGSVGIMLSKRKNNQKDFIVMQAYMFPYINILWLGCLTMVVGTGIAVWQRVKKNYFSQV
ncbi:MAG: cytochrome c biogenesis protein CcsA [Bacteroidetes bacterium]|nr:cytochrome c biogenesis protein CcsA [Bacteroidota bacterium]